MRNYEDMLFKAELLEKGWYIKHKASGKRIGIGFKALPKESSSEYVLGYAKCLGYKEGWYN